MKIFCWICDLCANVTASTKNSEHVHSLTDPFANNVNPQPTNVYIYINIAQQAAAAQPTKQADQQVNLSVYHPVAHPLLQPATHAPINIYIYTYIKLACSHLQTGMFIELGNKICTAPTPPYKVGSRSELGQFKTKHQTLLPTSESKLQKPAPFGRQIAIAAA